MLLDYQESTFCFYFVFKKSLFGIETLQNINYYTITLNRMFIVSHSAYGESFFYPYYHGI